MIKTKTKLNIKGLDRINKTQEYLNYLQNHLLNIQKAFYLVEEKCHDLFFIYDDFKFVCLQIEVENHDLSKFSPEEFCYYRQKYFPTTNEKLSAKKIDEDFEIAWQHHLKYNDHHWETWTSKLGNNPHVYNEYQQICCVHMVIDWIAMGMYFNNTALEYYEKNKAYIKIPVWAERLVYEICDRVYD